MALDPQGRRGRWREQPCGCLAVQPVPPRPPPLRLPPGDARRHDRELPQNARPQGHRLGAVTAGPIPRGGSYNGLPFPTTRRPVPPAPPARHKPRHRKVLPGTHGPGFDPARPLHWDKALSPAGRSGRAASGGALPLDPRDEPAFRPGNPVDVDAPLALLLACAMVPSAGCCCCHPWGHHRCCYEAAAPGPGPHSVAAPSLPLTATSPATPAASGG